ncbi:diguanylate cyclase domain-containing protein [Paenibacillus sp. CN-4]|uniref:diguanylate cyclase domain-containing protein n=1 Tax=Paenibacillus nanchangensis TaxID=3348343 RepID=UPI00397D89F1
MEELYNYGLGLLTLAIAAAAVLGVLRMFRDIAHLSWRGKALRFAAGTALLLGGLAAMHAAGRFRPGGASSDPDTLLFPLAGYGLTMAALAVLITRVRSVYAEREQLKELAYKDSLTGLLNKNGMEHFWNRCKENEPLAVLYLDLNRFKSINDKLGHHAGDQLITAVGGTLSQFSSKGRRHIFRIGGDEFVIIARKSSRKEAEQLAVRVLEKVTRSYQLDSHSLNVSASIGIAMSRGKVHPAKLLKEADSAMYNAKQLGTGRYSVYHPGQTGTQREIHWNLRTGSGT